MQKVTTGILILTHDAPEYVEETLATLNEVTAPEDRAACQVVVLDNASGERTRSLLGSMKSKGYIDKLLLSPENTFFARGNNMAADISDANARYILLLNSDVRINDPGWLKRLIGYKEEGGYAAAAYGRIERPDRADGYCLLLDRALYMKYRLDENFPWWGGVTKLQYEMLRDGHSILAIDNHDRILYHYGGKSGSDYKAAGALDGHYQDMVRNFDKMPGKVTVCDMAPSKGFLAALGKKMKKVRARVKRLCPG